MNQEREEEKQAIGDSEVLETRASKAKLVGRHLEKISKHGHQTDIPDPPPQHTHIVGGADKKGTKEGVSVITSKAKLSAAGY